MNHKHLLAGVAATALLTAGSAFAASHSGDQLQAQAAMIDALSKKVEQLSANQGGIAAGVKGVSLKISGHVNRAVSFVNDGNDKSVFNYVDNDASSTRVRWDADAPVSATTEVGTRLEMEMESNSSINTVLNGQSAAAVNDLFSVRHAYVYIKGGFGTLITGQQGEATEGILHSSFNYASLASVNPEDTNGVGNAGVNFVSFGDGGRQDAVRYDTPNFGGAKASISARDNGDVTAAIRFQGKVAGLGVLAGLGYEANPGANNDPLLAGSFGIDFGGIALNGAFGEELDDNNNDRFFYAVGLAHKGNYVDMGATSLGVQYMANNGGFDGQGNVYSVGFGLVQGVAAGAEAYAHLAIHGGNEGAIDNAVTSMVGMRVKF